MSTIYRVQCKAGRGPFKPGLSHLWIDENRDTWPPTFMEEFGTKILKKIPNGCHRGCGFHSLKQLERWFTPVELDRLSLLGYRVVRLDNVRVLARSKHQLIFIRKKPLSEGAKIQYGELEHA